MGTAALTRGDMNAAKAVQQATGKALTYEPRTDTGQALNTAINTLGAATIGKATDFLSDKAADVAGPGAGATAHTVLEGAPYVLGMGPEMSAARGMVKAVSNPAAMVRDVVGAAGDAAPRAAAAGTADAGATAAEPAQAPPAAPTQPAPAEPAAGAPPLLMRPALPLVQRPPRQLRRLVPLLRSLLALPRAIRSGCVLKIRRFSSPAPWPTK